MSLLEGSSNSILLRSLRLDEGHHGVTLVGAVHLHHVCTVGGHLVCCLPSVRGQNHDCLLNRGQFIRAGLHGLLPGLRLLLALLLHSFHVLLRLDDTSLRIIQFSLVLRLNLLRSGDVALLRRHGLLPHRNLIFQVLLQQLESVGLPLLLELSILTLLLRVLTNCLQGLNQRVHGLGRCLIHAGHLQKRHRLRQLLAIERVLEETVEGLLLGGRELDVLLQHVAHCLSNLHHAGGFPAPHSSLLREASTTAADFLLHDLDG
mmetsp:Transcript_10750/g.25672  ORF Transcript_10750/g.25672 Transcript_10750/m.25672 type:complete len:261 (+) Transcript_10750:1024-1806(+)